ncbi:hypothetical protein LCGC14_2858350, partial [marine sediment metagenome]
MIDRYNQDNNESREPEPYPIGVPNEDHKLQRAQKEIERLKEALRVFVPKPHGAFGGPLVGVIFNYEDGDRVTLG